MRRSALNLANACSVIRKIIEARGAFLRYLPAYSPDLNPIEQAFAKFKALLRKAAARTIKRLWREIAKAIKSFEPKRILTCLLEKLCDLLHNCFDFGLPVTIRSR